MLTLLLPGTMGATMGIEVSGVGVGRVAGSGRSPVGGAVEAPIVVGSGMRGAMRVGADGADGAGAVCRCGGPWGCEGVAESTCMPSGWPPGPWEVAVGSVVPPAPVAGSTGACMVVLVLGGAMPASTSMAHGACALPLSVVGVLTQLVEVEGFPGGKVRPHTACRGRSRREGEGRAPRIKFDPRSGQGQGLVHSTGTIGLTSPPVGGTGVHCRSGSLQRAWINMWEVALGGVPTCGGDGKPSPAGVKAVFVCVWVRVRASSKMGVPTCRESTGKPTPCKGPNLPPRPAHGTHALRESPLHTLESPHRPPRPAPRPADPRGACVPKIACWVTFTKGLLHIRECFG